MKKNFTLLTVVLIFVLQQLGAQNYVHQVLVLNEGYYNYQTSEIVTPVTVGSYDPATKVYSTVNTIEGARFASDIQVFGDFYYVAADNHLLKFDRNTHQQVASQTVMGIRKIAVSENIILATRGEYLVSYDAYVQVFDTETLAFVNELTAADSGILYPAEGVIIDGDVAYIAINNGFDFGNEVGLLATVNLSDYTTDIADLGPDGKNPDNLMFDGEKIYTLNNKDYTGSSVSTLSVTGSLAVTTNLAAVSAGCGTSALFEDAVLFQELGNTKLGSFDPNSQTTTGFTEYGKSFYGMAADPVNPYLYAAETDYFSFGEVFIYDNQGLAIDSFEVSISPGNIAFDVRSTTGTSESALNRVALSVFPNPATDALQLRTELAWHTCVVNDAQGKQILSRAANGDQTIALENLLPGMYVLRLYGENGEAVARFVKF